MVETWHHRKTKAKEKDIVILGVVDPKEKQAQITVFCDLEEMTTGLLAKRSGGSSGRRWRVVG